jgi:hypothetical protein
MRAARFIAAALAGALTLAGLAGLAGCDGNPEWPPLRLEQSQATAYLNVGKTQVRITGGSGNYQAVINDHGVADVSFEYGSDVELGRVVYLTVAPKAVGSAIVVVTDKRSGGTALLGLKVENRHRSFRVAGFVTNVVADNPDLVEAYMLTTARLSKGDGVEFSVTGTDGRFIFSNAEGYITMQGTVKVEDFTEIPPLFTILDPSARPIYFKKWTLSANGETWWCGAMAVEDETVYTRLSVPRPPVSFRFYEDLTEQYKAKFPDAGIERAGRMVIVAQSERYLGR